MNKVVMYTTANCIHCEHAKQLLNLKNVPFTEIFVDADDEQRKIMMELTGNRSVPQIIINDTPIGGFDDLKELEMSGELDDILKESQS